MFLKIYKLRHAKIMNIISHNISCNKGVDELKRLGSSHRGWVINRSVIDRYQSIYGFSFGTTSINGCLGMIYRYCCSYIAMIDSCRNVQSVVVRLHRSKSCNVRLALHGCITLCSILNCCMSRSRRYHLTTSKLRNDVTLAKTHFIVRHSRNGRQTN